MISICIPVYKTKDIIPALIEKIEREISKVADDYEILFIDDGSPDGAWNSLLDYSKKNNRIKGIHFSRNFGQHYAITAGIAHAKGDYIIVMDCDLQHDPKYISSLYTEALKGNDIVYTYTRKRKHSFIKNLFAKIFTLIFNLFTDSIESHYNVGSFSLITRQVAQEYLRIKDKHRHYLLILRWLGFRKTYIEIEHKERYSGRSSYTLKKLIHHAIDGITSQSVKLLKYSILIGMVYFILSIVGSVYLVINAFLYGYMQGWASLVVLLLLSTGLILMAIGISSIYIGNIFDQVKNRPLYIIAEKVNL
ncbi:MAG: glycosyltransferase family 2 protein [Leptospiraceae bacterium]|nr:glycosyltransferase family 2 protein [Leptospiraceae bacterium]